MTKLRRFTRRRMLLALSVVFFLIYWLPSSPFAFSDSHLILNQPDEGLFYDIARQVSLGTAPGREELFTTASLSQVHPRSATVVHGRIVPIAFPAAMILFGLLARLDVIIVGTWLVNISLSAITPLLAALCPLVLYYLVRKVSGQSRLAFHSALFLFILPPFWYYASRPFQPHILFIFLLLSAAAIYTSALNQHHYRRLWQLYVAFTMVGFALIVRPVELMWVVLLGLLILWFTRKQLHRQDMMILIPAAITTLIIYAAVQLSVYGNIFGSGYVKPAADGTAGLLSSGPQGIHLLQALVAPFGVLPIAIAKTAYHYLLRLFSLWSLAAMAASLAVIWAKADDHRVRKYFLGYGLVAALLLIYYGTWQFTDNLAGQVSIGSSQVRYFLPIYVAAAPLLGMCSLWLFRQRRPGQLVATFVIGALAFSSYSAVFTSFEGINHIRNVKEQYAEYQARIYAHVPAEAVIITRYGDKYLYPERKVIAGLDDADMRAGTAALLEAGTELYLYDLAGYANSDAVQAWLADTGATLALMDQFDDLELYRIEKNLSFTYDR